MKFAATLFLALFGISFLAPAVRADEDKEVKLKGLLMCAKCQLHETTKCQNVLQVKKDGKTTKYYFKDNGSKEAYHKGICGGGTKRATVTGVVEKQGGKNWVMPTSVKINKKQ